MKTQVEKDRTGSRFTYAGKEGVETSKERRNLNGGRALGGRGKMERSGVEKKGGRMI